MKRIFLTLAMLLCAWSRISAQMPTDSLALQLPVDTLAMPVPVLAADTLHPMPVKKAGTPYRMKPLQLILPTTLIGIGIIGVESDWLKYQNKEVRDELQEHIGHRISIDNYTQYAPMVAAYGLRLCGVKGQHDYADLTIILGTSALLMGTTVNVMKYSFRVMRPDGSRHNSFPSGHTATAFMGAELLRREYWNVSPWIGVAGYAVAAGTGFGRLYNNRHWLTDVMAGAGIGILSVQAAYWLYPVVARTFFHKRWLRNAYFAPYADADAKGVSCSIIF